MATNIGYVPVLGQDNLAGFSELMDWENNKWTLIAGGAAAFLIISALVVKKKRRSRSRASAPAPMVSIAPAAVTA